jgi:hypothetical protein
LHFGNILKMHGLMDIKCRSDNCLQKFNVRVWRADTTLEMQAWEEYLTKSILEKCMRSLATYKWLRGPSSGRLFTNSFKKPEGYVLLGELLD